VLSPSVSALLRDAGLDPLAVASLVRAALAEDLDGGVDVTSVATVPADQVAVGDFVTRADGVVAGIPVVLAVLELVGPDEPLGWDTGAKDGDAMTAGQIILTVRMRTQALLTAERTALNLLGRLSGIATLTRKWVHAIDGTGAEVRDTRKTTPGLRALEKYAVRCGGGVNHRMSLSDAALVKDNHVVAAGGVAAAFEAVRARWPGLPVEVEVDSAGELGEVLDAGADLVLLDNFDVPALRTAVALTAGRARLEASGGLTLESAHDVAATGVDYLAVGALTHSAPVLDVALDLRPRSAGANPGAGAGEDI
jgi:nicotinate-nucleotide pyrophosphorylase (carboxylating)